MILNRQIENLYPLKLLNSGTRDFEVSWAGECPWNQGFCLGSEDGKVKFVNKNLHTESGPWPFAESGEAINGVAFWNDLMVVSTPSEVVIWDVPKPDAGKFVQSAVYEGGAHGVHVTASGGFIAPLGKNGLLAMEPLEGKLRTWKSIGINSKRLYFYKVENLLSTAGGIIHACAVRRDGLATVVDNGTTGYSSLRTFPDSDIIDVCSTGYSELPLSAIALGIDRSLHFVRNVLHDRKPQTLKFNGWCGTAYRVFRAQSHVIMLTSERLYVMKDLASRFSSGQRIDLPTTTVEISIEAVDATIAFGRWLLIVLPDGLISIDTERWAHIDSGISTRDLTPSMHSDGEAMPLFELAFAAV